MIGAIADRLFERNSILIDVFDHVHFFNIDTHLGCDLFCERITSQVL